MGRHLPAFAALLLLLSAGARAEAEIFVRWDQDRVPSPQSLGVATLVVPETSRTAVRNALAHGYRVFLEVEAKALASFAPPAEGLAGVVVKGQPSPEQLVQLGQRLESSLRQARDRARVRAVDERGKWPHIRSNLVTKNKDVLQVSGRSQQPWIENNAALIRIAEATQPGPPLLTYTWTPVTRSEIDEGPAVENYLVAIAEAGAFGADLVLPLHERLQQNLLLDRPHARSEWNEIRRYVDFFSLQPRRIYHPVGNIAVVAAEPMQWFEVMNLLARHNLPFEPIAPSRLASRDLDGFDLLIVLDAPRGAHLEAVAAFARKGGVVVLRSSSGEAGPPWRRVAPLLKTGERVSYRFGEGRVVEVLKGIGDPDAFALEVRQLVGRERRVIDIWNGVTVLTALYQEPDGRTALVTALNYAHQPLPVQLRVRGMFSLVQYESPEEPSALLKYEHRDGYTEFVLPALRIGGRIVLTRGP